MTNVAQVFTKDERFLAAVEATMLRLASAQDEVVRFTLDPSRVYLELRYCQQRSLTMIARQLHCSQRTLQRYYERKAHEYLHQQLRKQAPDLARLFWRCVGQSTQEAA